MKTLTRVHSIWHPIKNTKHYYLAKKYLEVLNIDNPRNPYIVRQIHIKDYIKRHPSLEFYTIRQREIKKVTLWQKRLKNQN